MASITAWLLVTTGMPSAASIAAMASTARKFVQDANAKFNVADRYALIVAVDAIVFSQR